MKTRLIINLYLLAVLITSCQSEKYENTSLFSLRDFKKTVKLNAVTVDFDDLILLPHLFVKSDSLFIIQNIFTKNLLYVYNINSKKKVGEFIARGSGPNDLIGIKNMQLLGSELIISDSQKRMVFIYDVNDFHQLTKNLTPKQKVPIEDYCFQLATIENGYVGIAMSPDNKRLVYYNSKGEKELASGEYPYYGKEFTKLEKIEGFNSQIVVSHKNKRIYLFGMTTDLIEIYDFQGMLIKKLHGPDHFFPQVKENRSTDGYSTISAKNSIFAYFHPIIVDNEIYVSYSGHHYVINEEVARVNHIFVFDLDCNPIRRYELSETIASFTVDIDTKLIYATSNTPDYHMVVFEQ